MPSRTFPAVAASVPEARGYVTALLAPLAPDVCEVAALLVSELATNAIRHAGGRTFEVTVRPLTDPDRVWCGVSDTGSSQPVLRSPAVTDEHGRGLRLIGVLSDRWGAHRRRATDTKTVWFELNYDPRAPAPADRTPEAERTA
ncbi:ATP-binding protein [Blastococcus sp. VKM Ac-2987]|uniref:ATP-binding protein n=1 Tax=Blastococcus sp. VKM Ac-2987 TaxID=3004141 RepID=UPI0022AB5007|nr:ATP-binding protein [Blastococcus sp. VKM Ac-2987]MCZ2860870.1 ATP-binding protein [Blastococcus sp. VKM Ac-2987]